MIDDCNVDNGVMMFVPDEIFATAMIKIVYVSTNFMDRGCKRRDCTME